MITEFDKTSAVTLYKRKFAECIKNQLFEEAFDVLLKFSEVKENPEFHLACGMLYLLIAQDSDDRELLTMAHREFMLHLREHSDCEAAYRNLFATAIMRREPMSLVECTDWLKARGMDVDGMVETLADVGVSVFSDDNELMYLEALFELEDFGTIGAPIAAPTKENPDTNDVIKEAKKPSKVIPFKGGKPSETHGETKGDGKIIEIDSDDVFDSDIFKQMADFDLDDDETDADEDFSEFVSDKHRASNVDDWKKELPVELRSRMALGMAEKHCENGEYDDALSALDEITTEDKQLHYCAQCVRAFIYSEREELDKARAALNIALGIKRKGALAGTLMCALYEATGEFDKIPQTLKNIDVTDYIDADHVYKAMRLAVRYCETKDVLELARDYIEEFNVMDIRMLYAQILYNSGARDEAIKELYALSRLFYDDFNAQYYYLMAKMGVDKMPVSEESPQHALSRIVDTLIGVVQAGAVDGEMIETEAFALGLEVFLTLEYQNDKKTELLMFDTLGKLAANPLLEDKMRQALCSPFVEPIVKAVILSAILARSDEFVASVMYCPFSDDSVPTLGDGYPLGCYTAYAFVLVFCRREIKRFIELVGELLPKLSRIGTLSEKAQEEMPSVEDALCAERDIAYYLIRTMKKTAKRGTFDNDDRIEYALGYRSKTAANSAYKAIEKQLKKQ